MTPDETLNLLKLVAASDRRTVGPEDVMVWHAVLSPLDFTRCRDAVIAHIRNRPGTWLEPGHIWAGARTTTTVQATDLGHGATLTVCATCKLNHDAHEPCDVLEQRPELLRRALNVLTAGPRQP